MTGRIGEQDLEARSWEEIWSSVLQVPHAKLVGMSQPLQPVAHPSFVADPCYLVTFPLHGMLAGLLL